MRYNNARKLGRIFRSPRSLQMRRLRLALHLTGGIMIIIYGIKEHLNPVKAQLSEVIHGCMQSVLGMPEDKRAHRFMPMGAEDFYTQVAERPHTRSLRST